LKVLTQKKRKKRIVRKKKQNPKKRLKKHKREKTEKTEKPQSYDPEEDPEPETKKKEERKPKKPSSKKAASKPEENLLPFDPFAPASGQQRPPSNNYPFSPSQVANPFFPGGIQQQPQQQPLQPNLITTAPLTGGNFDFGFNQPIGSLQVNMGLLALNQPSSNFNPGGVNPSNSNPFNPGVANPSVGYNQPVNANPYSGGFNVTGSNPFTAGSSFNSQPSNPFSTPQNANPFLNNNPSSAPYSNQNPLF